jgi:hypothetical protein
MPVGSNEIDSRNRDSANASWAALYGHLPDGTPTGAFETDPEGRIVPTDSVSMLASLAQIDAVGVDPAGSPNAVMADIRIFTITDANGNITGYRVQIPSTQSWDPNAGAHGAPNDLTSDMFAMTQGDSTALAQSVYLAMDKAGIDKNTPVELDGFSLGGITAGAIAADNTPGYNITAIHTAGSPIAGFDIPDSVQVTSLEADQDAVPTLDGSLNPDRPGWTTIHRSAASLTTDQPDATLAPFAFPGTDMVGVHDADRYAAMAAGDPALTGYGALDIPPGGKATAQDYYAQRAH